MKVRRSDNNYNFYRVGTTDNPLFFLGKGAPAYRIARRFIRLSATFIPWVRIIHSIR